MVRGQSFLRDFFSMPPEPEPPEKAQPNMTIQSIIQAIEDARKSGQLGNDAARAATVALGLTGNDAMLACRIIAQGADPASIEYLVTGQVSDTIALAHRQGPGSLTGKNKQQWLNLASLSADESKNSTLRDRFWLLADAVRTYNLMLDEGSPLYADILHRAMELEDKILSLPYTHHVIGGRKMRVYTADLGFAAAYWQGEPCAAVLSTYNGEPYISVGSNGPSLADLGVTVNKLLSPCYGIIEDATTIASIKAK